MLEAADMDRSRTWTLSLNAADLPPELESLLVARVDRLTPEARRLAHVAAVIGRTFPVRILELVAGEEAVRDHLPALLRGEIVREVRRYPELECSFAHGLLQEAALSTLTPTRRRELYGQVGAAYEALFADSLEERAEQLAFLFYRSDDQGKALHYLERAAERAVLLDAREHAVDLYRRGRKAAGRLGDEGAQGRLSERLAALGAEPTS
jgi:predicted ATPase